MSAKKDGGAPKPAQITVVLRLAAGGYLVYLAFGLFKEYLKPSGGGQLMQIGAAAVFAVFGAVLAAWSLKKFMKGDYIRYGESPEDDGEEEPEEENKED